MEANGLGKGEHKERLPGISAAGTTKITELSGGAPFIHGTCDRRDHPRGETGVLLFQADGRILTVRIIAIPQSIQIVVSVVVAFLLSGGTGIGKSAGRVGAVDQAVTVFITPA